MHSPRSSTRTRGRLSARRLIPRTRSRSSRARTTSETTQSRAVSGLELQVLDRLLDGARGAALAQALGVSYASVRTRIRNLLRELAGPQLDTIAFAVDDDTRRNGPSREL